MPEESSYRFPGTRPFTELEESFFFGRSNEVEQIFSSIKSNNVLLLHGISGMGKSSLINAGLTPKLRDNNFLTIKIRFSEQKKEKDLTEKKETKLKPLGRIIKKVKAHLNIERQSFEIPENLWICIKLLNQIKKTPVLIFDQFEEFFYNNSPDIEEAIQPIADLATTCIPEEIENGKYDDFISYMKSNEESTKFSWYTPAKVKMLFSIRSDRLDKLEVFSSRIPALFQQRYQLKGLKTVYAEQAVVLPAMQPGSEKIKFKSKPFEFEADLVKTILKVLDNTKGIAETTQMQMICKEIEEIVIARQVQEDNIVMTEKELNGEEGVRKLISNYYNNQLKKIETADDINEFDFLQIRILLETKLLIQGKRILISNVSVIHHFKEASNDIDEKKIDDIIELLLDLRLIQVQNYDGNIFYEIAHDSLVDSILKAREKRENEEKIKKQQRELKEQEEIRKKELRDQKKRLKRESDLRQAAEEAQAEAEQERNNAREQEKKARESETIAIKNEQKALRLRQRALRITFIAIAFLFISSFLLVKNRQTSKKLKNTNSQIVKQQQNLENEIQKRNELELKILTSNIEIFKQANEKEVARQILLQQKEKYKIIDSGQGMLSNTVDSLLKNLQ